MRTELEKKLRKEFKFYKGYYGKGLPFECGDGWYDLLYDLSKGIQKLIDEGKESPNFTVYQVKEKYGTLRFYTGGYSTTELEDLIDKAEERSAETCEQCGKPGKLLIEKGWHSTVCETCCQEQLIRSQELWKSIKGIKTPNEDKEAKNG